MSTKNARITVVSRYSDIEVTIPLHYGNNIINEILRCELRASVIINYLIVLYDSDEVTFAAKSRFTEYNVLLICSS